MVTTPFPVFSRRFLILENGKPTGKKTSGEMAFILPEKQSKSTKVSSNDETKSRSFQTKWLSLHSWLRYEQAENKMYCSLCTEAGCENAKTLGSTHFKTSTLNRHVSSSDHKRALQVPSERVHMVKAVKKTLNKEEDAIVVAMKVVYWITIEAVPPTKYSSLMTLLRELNTPFTDVLCVNNRVNYGSYTTALDLLGAISEELDAEVTKKTTSSSVITILTDESTDIVAHHKLCISARDVDPLTLKPSTLFLTDLCITEATGRGIFEDIEKHLSGRNISLTKVMGLGTDGASTMTGTKQGLTGQFLRKNPHLQSNHCAARRLALCTEQSAKQVSAMSEFQRTLEMLFYHFKKSPCKKDKMEKIQTVLNEPTLKYREVHQVRCLSFREALDAVYQALDSLITYLGEASATDSAATGLKKRIATELFISLTYAVMDILVPVMSLSLTFQKRDLDIGIVQVSVNECIRNLEEIRDSVNPLEKPTFLAKLAEDLKDGMFKGHAVSRMKTPTEFKNAKIKFIDAVLQNIAKRFPSTQMMSHFSMLALHPVSFLSNSELLVWDNDSIQALIDFYGCEQSHAFTDPATKEKSVTISKSIISREATMAEWQKIKVLVKRQQYPRLSMADLWGMEAYHHKDKFRSVMALASLALTHPVHTADCERAFSSQNLVTTPIRNRLSADNCDKLLRVMCLKDGEIRKQESC